MRLIVLAGLVFAWPSLGLAASPAVDGSTATSKLQQWMKAYPDSVDFDGAPLKILSEMPLGYAESSDVVRGAFQKIKAEYPTSKLIPYVDYSLAVSTADLALIAQKYKKEVFPSVCSDLVSSF